jgi:hypothetical protein
MELPNAANPSVEAFLKRRFLISSGCFFFKAGKRADKASNDAFIMYSNYAIDLGLLAKLGQDYYITPSGIRFILLLELNKSILFVNSI